MIIGDSFFAKTHQITAYLEDLSRDQGTLPEGERYSDSSRTVGNTLAVGDNGVTDQYAAAVADGAVSVVIMNGGGADALLAQCDPIDSNCPELVNVAMAAESLLAAMATDGVTDVVYAYYPATTDEALSAKLGALQPLLESACSNAALDCRWIDLDDTFSGNAATYLAADGNLPTWAGSKASAREIWRVAQNDCIGRPRGARAHQTDDYGLRPQTSPEGVRPGASRSRRACSALASFTRPRPHKTCNLK